jgi:hypothetical protein
MTKEMAKEYRNLSMEIYTMVSGMMTTEMV